MSKPPHQVQILRLRRLKHGSVPGITKHLSVQPAGVRSLLWPQPVVSSAAAEPAPEAAPKEPPRPGHPLHEPIVHMYLCDRFPIRLIAQVLGVSQSLVRRVQRGAGSVRSKPPLPHPRRSP